jgi:hypothetical protein
MIQRDLTTILKRRDELRASLDGETNSDDERAQLEWELLLVERELARYEDE